MIRIEDVKDSFISSIARQKIDTDLKRQQIDLMEDRFDQFFAIKYFKLDNQILSYMCMPFPYEPVLEQKEIDADLLELNTLGIIPNEQVYILNDLDVQDTAQTIMFNPENEEVWGITIGVECDVEGSYYNDDSRSWILPLGTKEASFTIVPLKNKISEFDFSDYHEFSIKSMEKRTNYVILNDEEGIQKIYLPKEKSTFRVNVVQDNWDQIIRVKLIINENSKKWLTHYISFKTA